MMKEKDWLFSSEEYVCGLRSAGVLVRGDRILVQRDQNGEEYALPGGYVKIGESTEDAMIREFLEETGAEVRIKRLLWSEECFWEWNAKQIHSIVFYYLIELCDDTKIPDMDAFVSQKDNDSVVLGWLNFDRLSDVTVFPEFLKQEIDSLDGAVRHFVTQ